MHSLLLEISEPGQDSIQCKRPVWLYASTCVGHRRRGAFQFMLTAAGCDASFQLMRTLLDGLPKHLRPGGKTLLAYGCVDGIKTLKAECAKRGYTICVVDDDRDLDTLPEEFLPGMLLAVTLRERRP